MNSNIKQVKSTKYFIISMCIATKEHLYEEESGFDIFTFLLRYSFLLNDTSKPQNSCVQKTPQLNAPQGNIYMGARYLDPKYSRWISVDPALGEYIPAAGKGNSENAGNLPGMGGIYNHINGDLYHYAGNNPVRYVDPDGREDTGVYIQQGHKKTFAQKMDDELTRFLYRNILMGGAYNADGTGDMLIRTMDGRMITLSRSGEKYFSNSEKNIDRSLFLCSLFGSELGLLSKLYPCQNAETCFSSNTKMGDSHIVNGKEFKSRTELNEHFLKHGDGIRKALGRETYTMNEYLADANYIIRNGEYSSELNGYVKFISGKKYGFVGLDRATGDITTFHIKSVDELSKKAPSLGIRP